MQRLPSFEGAVQFDTILSPTQHSLNLPLSPSDIDPKMSIQIPSTKSFLLSLCTAVLLIGCATPPTPKATAQEPVDAETAAILYIYRPNNGPVGAAVTYEAYVDGVLVGRLGSKSSLSLKVAPGAREVIVFPKLKILGTTSTSYKLTVNVEPKQSKYIRFNVAIGNIAIYGKAAVANNNSSLTEATEEDWRARN